MTAVVAAGMLAGLGLALLVLWLVPAQPDLSSALDRLDHGVRPHWTRWQILTTDRPPGSGSGSSATCPRALASGPDHRSGRAGRLACHVPGQAGESFVVGLVFPTLPAPCAFGG